MVGAAVFVGDGTLGTSTGATVGMDGEATGPSGADGGGSNDAMHPAHVASTKISAHPGARVLTIAILSCEADHAAP
jgi:hypothetical protein